jgi:predicted nucleic acid-binding protein
MIVLDASALIAFLEPSDAHHQAAVALVAGSLNRGLAIHSLTLAEVLVGAVRGGVGPELCSELDEMGLEEVPRAPGEPLRLAELRVRTGLKLPDCCVILAAQHVEGTVATFDARLARAAAQEGLDVVP